MMFFKSTHVINNESAMCVYRRRLAGALSRGSWLSCQQTPVSIMPVTERWVVCRRKR